MQTLGVATRSPSESFLVLLIINTVTSTGLQLIGNQRLIIFPYENNTKNKTVPKIQEQNNKTMQQVLVVFFDMFLVFLLAKLN